MTNTNILHDIGCPQCGHRDSFEITATITCRVTDDGSEPFGDHEWNNDRSVTCVRCGYGDRLRAFRIPPGLPPDPEGMNDRRTAWAHQAVTAFRDATGADEDDALGNLLADLMHWADRNDFDFAAALDRARFHYDAETTACHGPDSVIGFPTGNEGVDP